MKWYVLNLQGIFVDCEISEKDGCCPDVNTMPGCSGNEWANPGKWTCRRTEAGVAGIDAGELVSIEDGVCALKCQSDLLRGERKDGPVKACTFGAVYSAKP